MHDYPTFFRILALPEDKPVRCNGKNDWYGGHVPCSVWAMGAVGIQRGRFHGAGEATGATDSRVARCG